MPLEQRVLPAPYLAFEPLPSLEALSSSSPLARGTLVVLRPCPGASAGEIEEGAHHAWRTSARTTVILWLDLLNRLDAVEISGVAGAIGIRGLVVGAQPDARVLRRELTDPYTLAADCIAWLRRQEFAVSPRVHRYLEIGLTQRKAWRNATELLAVAAAHRDGKPRHNEPGKRLLERELQRLRAETNGCRLGHPGPLLQVVRMFAVANAIQRQPAEPLARLAREYSFYDERHLRQRIADVFGCAPTDIRRWLGREWLLHVAFARAALPSWSE